MSTKYKCATPGCDCVGPVVLHGKCHPDSPTWTWIDNDVLTVVCAECEKTVSIFKVVLEEA